MQVTHLRRRDIDEHHWNAAVAADPTNLPYGYTWWLDAATNNRWNGLILDNYRVVLPLPYRWQFGRYTQVQRPPFTQQCGPFGQLRPDDVAYLLDHLPAGIRSLRLPLSESVDTEEISNDFQQRQRTNLLLHLGEEYEQLQKGYHRILRRKLRKYGEAKLSEADPETILDIYRNGPGKKAGLKSKHYTRVRVLMEAARARKKGLLVRADEPDGELLAAGFFPVKGGRMINLFAASSALGYRREGMARLLDGLLRQHLGDGNIFDFEGSDIPGVAEFFRSFGPQERPYVAIS